MTILENLVGLVAPPDCLVCGEEGSALCVGCSTSNVIRFGPRCWRCNKLSPNGRTCDSCRHTSSPYSVWITTNYEGVVSQLVRKYKFGHMRAAAEPMARLMSATFRGYYHEKDYLIVPIPTATSRVRERGFGHSEMLAKKLARNLRMPYSKALRRLDQTRQLGSVREARLVQLADSFAVRKSAEIEGSKILLVDDVLTTGGTLISATKILKDAGAAKVDALVFAKRL